MQIKNQLNDLKTIKFQVPGKVYYHRRYFDGRTPHFEHVADIALDGNPVTDLTDMRNIVFTYFNGMDPGVLLQVDLKFPTIRSMSVGDVLVLGEQAWLCEPVGWSEFDVSKLPRESMSG